MTDTNPTPEERIVALMAQARAAAEEATAIAESSADGVNLPAVGAGAIPAEVAKRKMAELRAVAVKKTSEINALREQMRAEMDAQLRAMNEALAPLKLKEKQMNEAIWSINLYLGRDEQIVTLTSGEPADADTPLTLRQEVLSMDEETAAHAEVGGIDARHLDVFDQWISQPENLARVLPEAKGVVVLVPRRRGRDYADPWVNDRMDKENKWSYFLIRNGENVYRMCTDFVVGKHLIPATDEFTGLFVSRRRNHTTGEYEDHHILPGTREWDKAEEKQGAKQRHYMRMALVLAGLVDRTAVLRPLPAAGLNLLDNRTYDEGRAVLLRDAEGVLTDGRPEFKQWLSDLTGQLRTGMRVMGAFGTDTFRHAGQEGGDHRDYSPNDRLTPVVFNKYDVDRPETGQLYQLDKRTTHHGERGFSFSFTRTAQRWYDGELRTPKTKGRCVVLPGDQFIIPFDLVSVDDMRYYLQSRRQRSAYEEMFPLLKAAIKAKEAEAEAEGPFRELLAGQVATAHGVELAEATDAVDDLVRWWKLKNRWHRPLVPTAEHDVDQAQAIRDIVTEFGARRRADEQGTADEQRERDIVAKLLEHDPTIMVIGRTRTGGYLAFAPQPRVYGSHLVSDRLWVVEHTTTTTGRTIKTRDWVVPGTRMDRNRVLHTADMWETWDVHSTADSDLTDDELSAMVEHAVYVTKGESAKGWPVRHHWGRGSRRGSTRDVLVLAVTADRKTQNVAVWLAPGRDPVALRTPGTAVNPRWASTEHGYARFNWSKKKGELNIPDPKHWDEWWNNRHYGSNAAHPWGKVWDSKSRDPRPVVEFAAAQEAVTAREEAISSHNNAAAELRKPAQVALRVVHSGHAAALEAKAYARFLEDYADPDLWEGHRKTLRGLYPTWHPSGRDLDRLSPLVRALYEALDAGRAFDGHTVGSIIAAAGLTVDAENELLSELLELPLTDEH